VLGRAGKLPPKAPTPLLKRRPLAERSNLPASALLPPAASAASSKKPSVKKPAPQPPKRPLSWASEKSNSEKSDLEAVESDNNGRSRKERFLFWKNPNKKSVTKRPSSWASEKSDSEKSDQNKSKLIFIRNSKMLDLGGFLRQNLCQRARVSDFLLVKSQDACSCF
jgi:hypothetical protein